MTTATQVQPEQLFHREHEILEGPVRFNDWERCSHGKQIAHCRAHWSDDAPFTSTTGRKNSDTWFEVTRHIDGTAPDIDELWLAHKGVVVYNHCMNRVAKCPTCGELDTLVTKQQAYGDDTTCTTPDCGFHSYYSIGD